MRHIGWLLFILVSIAWLSCEWELAAPPTSIDATADDWRRTVDGWERARHWSADRRSLSPPPPALITAALLAAALAALALAVRDGRSARRPPVDGSAGDRSAERDTR